MFLLLFALWIVLNGRVTLEVVLLGLPISAVLCLFISRFLGYSPLQQDVKRLRLLPSFVLYCGLLCFEIIKASLAVMRIVLSPSEEPEPTLISVRVPLRTELARVVLANSITLTPGTITVSLQGDHYRIHCLDKSMAEGIADSSFVRRLSKMEELL